MGRIFADLPTETRTGWSGHINATFFPRQDRKGVEFDSRGFRGKWNDLLLDAAAILLADNLETIAQELGHRVAWSYLVDVERVNRDIAKDEYPAVFSGFFERAKELAPASRIALLADETAVLPAGTLVPRDEEEYDAVEVLLRLGVPVLAPSIRPLARQTTLTQYGMSLLGIPDVASALEESGVTEAWDPEDERAPLTVCGRRGCAPTGRPPSGAREVTAGQLHHRRRRHRAVHRWNVRAQQVRSPGSRRTTAPSSSSSTRT